MSKEHRICSEKIKSFFVSYEQFPHRTRRCYKCTVCKQKVSSKETLRKHILIKHIKLKPHICSICGKSFIFEKSRILHEKTHNDDGPFYKCVCGDQFEEKSAFYHHKKLIHSSVLATTLLPCSFCHKSCLDKKQLRYHLQTRHASRTIHCTFPSCKMAFPTKTLFNHHVQTHLVESHACSICNKTFRLRSYLKRHKAMHKGIRLYECSKCEKKYLTASHLNTHRERVHSRCDGFLCFICGKTSPNKYGLILHENAHKGEKKFQCDLCDYKASFRASLYNHKKKHTSPPLSTAVIEPKTRSLRSEEERNKKNIPHYTRLPLEAKPFKCLDCDNAFKSAVRANEHWRRYHFVRAEFKCRICNIIFKDQIHFNIHKKSHEGEEPFKCDVCNRKTASKIGLQAHKKTHLKILPLNKRVERTPDQLLQNSRCRLEDQSGNTGYEDRFPHSDVITTEKCLIMKNDPTENISPENTLVKEDRFFLINEGSHFGEVSCSSDKRDSPQKEKCSKLKVKKESLCPLLNKMEDGSLFEEELYSLSMAGLLSEHTLDSVTNLDLSNTNNRFSCGETLVSGEAYTPLSPHRNPSFNIRRRRDPKITLNSTAILEDEMKFHNSHFV